MQKPSTVKQSKSTSSTTFIQEFVNIRLKNDNPTFVHSDLETPLGISKYQQSMCYRRHQHRQKCDFCTPQISVPRGTYTIKLINLSQFLKRLHVFCVEQNSYTSLGLLAKMKCSICSYQFNMSKKFLAVGSKLGTLMFLS